MRGIFMRLQGKLTAGALALLASCYTCRAQQPAIFDSSADPDFGVNYQAMEPKEFYRLLETDYKARLYFVVYRTDVCSSRDVMVRNLDRERPLKEFVYPRLERYLSGGWAAAPWLGPVLEMLQMVEAERGLPIVRRIVEREWPHDRLEGGDLEEAARYLLDLGDQSDLTRLEAAYARSRRMCREFGASNNNLSFSRIAYVYWYRDVVRAREIESMRRMAATDTSDPEWNGRMAKRIQDMEKKLAASEHPTNQESVPPRSNGAPGKTPSPPTAPAVNRSSRSGADANPGPPEESQGLAMPVAVGIGVIVLTIPIIVLARRGGRRG